MEWLRTLTWVLRGNGWGVVFMLALVSGVYAFVPMQVSGQGMSAVGSHHDLDR